MISILIVGREGEELGDLASLDPSVEILTAHGLEDALEKLARNRRVDAVLLAAGTDTRAIVDALDEDSPAHPPIFVPQGASAARGGAIPLPARETAQLINLLREKLDA